MTRRRSHRAVLIALLAAIPVLGWFASRAGAAFPSDLQNRFDHEVNSVRKAKLFEKLGDEQLAEIRRQSQAGDFNAVGQIMEKYRDNVRAASQALEKESPDGERHPNGYKQLEMHVQKGLREVDEILLISPPEFKPPLQLVRKDLLVLDDELLRFLFPRRHEKPPVAVTPPGIPPDSEVHP